MNSSPVYERTTSAFPLSVGTSLSLESLFDGPNEPIDPDRQIPQKVDINDYNEFWINIASLFRNMFNAIPRDRVQDTAPGDCVDVLLMEMMQIYELVNEESQGKTKVVYYYCSYKGLERELPGIMIRTPNTDKQKFYHNLQIKTLEGLMKRVRQTKETDVKEFDVNIYPDQRIKALMLTHHTVDLLSSRNFKSLDLLESHTGVLKHYNTWYTKYFNGKELMMIPFNKYLIKIFGDNDMIVPYHFKVRRVIQTVAVENKWNYSTSMAKVRSDISTIKDHYARNEILKLL